MSPDDHVHQAEAFLDYTRYAPSLSDAFRVWALSKDLNPEDRRLIAILVRKRLRDLGRE